MCDNERIEFLRNSKIVMRNYIPQQLYAVYHFLLALAAAAWYGFPSRGMVVIGVTGTKGKTTVVHLLHDILHSSGRRTASLSSVRFRIGDSEEMNTLKMTMPGRFFVQRFLYRAKKAGCQYAVIEVTSQGIVQSRHRFINFSAAILTNVAPEHIEAHGGFEPYVRAKLDLFWRLGRDVVAIINQDDALAGRFAAATHARRAWYSRDSIGIHGKQWHVKHIVVGPSGVSCEIGGKAITSSLAGEFNVHNILAASAAALSQGVSLGEIRDAVRRFSGVPGRMECVRREPFRVVVDYAHTPDSLQKVYETLRRENQKSTRENAQLICVLGAAGGGRDTWKRPEFGRIAAEFCDRIILTNEDPYDEDPSEILSHIKSGIPNPQFSISTILDRRDAIKQALLSARPGDIVVITGKGAEPWIMGPHGSKIPWDDREVVREEYALLPS